MELKQLARLNVNFAHYKDFAIFMPEVSGLDEPNRFLCRMYAEASKNMVYFFHFPTTRKIQAHIANGQQHL